MCIRDSSTIIKQSNDIETVELLFAKAQHLEHSENYQEAFDYLKRANQAHCKRINHVPFDWNAYSHRIIDVFDALKPPPTKASVDNKQPQPLFIVSMPRSGSTLVEQIVASHSSVFGASELNTFPQLIKQTEQQTHKTFPESWINLNQHNLKNIAEQYQKKINTYGLDYTYVSDKNLDNFNYVGAILSVMPNSLFIHCTRHPLDVCLSCYKQLFNAGQEYSYDLKELAEYCLHHEKIMSFWKLKFPKQILTINYEQVIDQTESNIVDILSFLKLPWEDACLEFYKTKRVIRTASAAQVTQKIYKAASHRHKKYGSSLDQLKNHLKSLFV